MSLFTSTSDAIGGTTSHTLTNVNNNFNRDVATNVSNPANTPSYSPSPLEAPVIGMAPSRHDRRRLEETRARWFKFMRNFDGSEGSAWTHEIEQQLCNVLHEDCLYEVPGIVGKLTPYNGYLTRSQMIYCFRQIKHMRCIMETEWMVEATTSGDSPYGQLQGSTAFKLPTTPLGLSQHHSSILTLAEDGRILRIQPKESTITQIVALQVDFLSLAGRS